MPVKYVEKITEKPYSLELFAKTLKILVVQIHQYFSKSLNKHVLYIYSYIHIHSFGKIII